MTRDALLSLHSKVCEVARSLMEKKNRDYGAEDVMGNLRLIEQLYPGDSIEKGIVIRMGDKLSRLAVLTRQEAAVQSEKIEDTCQDLINYAILLLAARSLRDEGKNLPALRLPVAGPLSAPELIEQERQKLEQERKAVLGKRTDGYPQGW